MRHDDNLTTKEYWDESYKHARDDALRIDGFRHRCEAKIYTLLASQIRPGSKVLEVGAGDSQWLPFLANKFPLSSFVGLDYSEIGCDRLRARVTNFPNASVVCDDFLEPRQPHERFDLVLSFGVVEHFRDLTRVLRSLRQYLGEEGRLFTVIPNMQGTVGTFTRMLNANVYAAHNAHGASSLRQSHEAAGLRVNSVGYLCSTNYGVLAAAVDDKKPLARALFLWLTRLSKGILYIEEVFGDMPPSKWFSPYLYCIATNEGNALPEAESERA